MEHKVSHKEFKKLIEMNNVALWHIFRNSKNRTIYKECKTKSHNTHIRTTPRSIYQFPHQKLKCSLWL